MTRTPEEQAVFDELTAAIAQHNKEVALTIIEAQKSLVLAKEQLARAEDSLDSLKKYIVDMVVNGGK